MTIATTAPALQLRPQKTRPGDEWTTPEGVFVALHKAFHFTLDVCALPETAKLPDYFTPEDDALSQHWSGRCFMNPPFGKGGRELPQWVAKAIVEIQAGRADLVCALLPARVDTRWWQDLVIPNARFVHFLRGRLCYGGGRGRAPFATAVVLFFRMP